MLTAWVVCQACACLQQNLPAENNCMGSNNRGLRHDSLLCGCVLGRNGFLVPRAQAGLSVPHPTVTCKCGLRPGSPIQTGTDGIASCSLGVLCSICAPIRKVCPNLVFNECLRAYVIEVASLGIGLVELFQINWLSCLYCLSGWGYVSTFNVYWQDLDHKEQIS